MRRQSGRHLNPYYYIEIELLPDDEYFSPSDIVKRKLDKKAEPESYNKMFHCIYQFGFRNGLALFPDNCVRRPNGKPVVQKNGKAKLWPGERSAKWTGKTWKSKLYVDDQEAILDFARSQLVTALQQWLAEKQQIQVMEKEHPVGKKRSFRLKKSLWVAVFAAAIVLTAGGLYTRDYLKEGYEVLKSDGPKAAFGFFQNRGESYDNLFGKAWAAFRNGEYDHAEALANRVLKSGDDHDRARGSYLLGSLKSQQGNFEDAQEHLQAAEVIYRSLGNAKSLYRTRLVQAKLYLDLKDIDNARYYSNLAGQNPEAKDDDYFNYVQSQIAFLSRDFEMALELALYREKVFAGDHSKLAGIYSDVGLYFGFVGDLDHCLEYTLKAEKQANKVEDSSALMFNSVNMYLYLKCSMKDYHELRLSILEYAQANNDMRLQELVNFIDKFNCPVEQADNGHPPPPDWSSPDNQSPTLADGQLGPYERADRDKEKEN